MDLRKIEVLWRSFWMRLLALMLPGPNEATLSSVQGPDCRVLFTRYERIGDMIMATSLIRNIALSLPSGRVDVLATSKNAPVLEGNPYVGKVLMLERGSIKSFRQVMKQIRRERYTVMVDGRINNPPIFTSTPLLMCAGRIQFRVGAGGDKTPRIYNVSVPAWDRVEHYIDGSKKLAVPFGVNPTSVDWQPEIFLSPEERARAEDRWNGARSLISHGSEASAGAGKRLLVNLSASDPKRRWPDGKFIATLQGARKRFPDMPMIVIGLPGEWSSVQEVANAVQALPAETQRLRDALALVGTADMVFTPDTSISHAASAFRKPSLVFIKRGHPYFPYNSPGEMVYWDDDNFQLLPYETVAKALDTLLTKFGS